MPDSREMWSWHSTAGEPVHRGVNETSHHSEKTMRSLTVLTLTDNATTEIRNMIDQPAVPEGCGLRIANDPANGGLTLTIAATPAAGDQVLDSAGARVFLDEEAATVLDDKALDATKDDGGQVVFAVAQQPV
jgi:iron-sulfur cluster assembly protein